MIRQIYNKISRRLSTLRRKSFVAEKWWQLRTLRRQCASSSNTIVVHQMSKVGSSTVVGSLKSSSPDILVLHSHFMSDEGLNWLENWVRERWGTIHVPRHLWQGRFAQQLYRQRKTGNRLKIVTLVRDPIARAISEFFEELDVHANYPYEKRVHDYGIAAVANELEQMLLETLISKVDWSSPFDWFDREIRDVFGIDLFAEDFESDTGFGIFQNDSVEILLLKLERLENCAGQAFDRFIGVSDLSLDRDRNIASRKYYAEAYGMILNRLRIPDSILETCYASEQVRHFYSTKDIQRFTGRWKSG